jgi:hypothetical protein
MTNPPGMPGSGQPDGQPPGPFDQPTQTPGWPQGQAGQPGQGGAIQPVPPPSGALAPSGEPILIQIGDISVTQSTVYTPSGARPLNEVQWSVTDMTVTSQSIPTWAIVCAIIFFLFCLLGLLFLLVKETVTKGTMQVTVHGSGFVHTTQIPIVSTDQVADINARVNYARTLNAAAFPGAQPPDQGPEQQRGQGW